MNSLSDPAVEILYQDYHLIITIIYEVRITIPSVFRDEFESLKDQVTCQRPNFLWMKVTDVRLGKLGS